MTENNTSSYLMRIESFVVKHENKFAAAVIFIPTTIGSFFF